MENIKALPKNTYSIIILPQILPLDLKKYCDICYRIAEDGAIFLLEANLTKEVAINRASQYAKQHLKKIKGSK